MESEFCYENLTFYDENYKITLPKGLENSKILISVLRNL